MRTDYVLDTLIAAGLDNARGKEEETEKMLRGLTGEDWEELWKMSSPLTFADKTDEKRPQIQYLCWFAALLSCHFFIVFFLFFCLCQNFFYFSQSSNAFAEIDIHGCPDIF